MIPVGIKRMVISQWLRGIPREEIAITNEISAGTISNIVNDERDVDLEIDFTRSIAVYLRNGGLPVRTFSSAIRLNNFSLNLGIPNETTESLIEKIHEHCFKKHKNISDFANLLIDHITLTEQYGISLDQFEATYMELIAKKNLYEEQAREAKVLRDTEIRLYGTTHKELVRFIHFKPVHDKFIELGQENARKQREISILKQ